MKRRGAWMQTASGKAYWPLDPRPEEIDIEDIAHALAHQCRYGGHCRRFYSVAEHSVHVSYLVPPEHALAGLLHDATEAYLVDVPRPVKPYLVGYHDIEEMNYRALAKRFKLPEKLPEPVKHADNWILIAERDALMAAPPFDWGITGSPPPVKIFGYSSLSARRLFLNRFKELTR